jgi:hypothetical protein
MISWISLRHVDAQKSSAITRRNENAAMTGGNCSSASEMLEKWGAFRRNFAQTKTG